MKKVAASFVILILAVGTMVAYQMRAGFAPAIIDSTIDSTLLEACQKPKGDELIEPFSQVYPISPTGRVSIANINGDVHINVWDQSSVKVDAVKRAYSQQSLSEVTIAVTNTPDSIKIKTEYPDKQSYGRNREHSAASVEYTLTVPRGASLQGVDLVNGSLDVEGLQGDMNASLVNGTVKADGLGGDVKISTVNGGIAADVSTLNGAKGVNLNSVNGPIVLIIPSGASADVKANTVHGKIINDFGLAVEDGQYVGHSLSGQIGSGGPRIRLNNVNGPIAIKRSGVAM